MRPFVPGKAASAGAAERRSAPVRPAVSRRRPCRVTRRIVARPTHGKQESFVRSGTFVRLHCAPDSERVPGVKRLILLAALPALVLAAPAQASFTQELGSPIPVDAAPYDVVAADFNRDGRPDLAAANGDRQHVSVLLRQPAAASPRRAPSIPRRRGPSHLAVADFNSDGRLDMASANYANPTGTGSVFTRNVGAGFTPEGSQLQRADAGRHRRGRLHRRPAAGLRHRQPRHRRGLPFRRNTGHRVHPRGEAGTTTGGHKYGSPPATSTATAASTWPPRTTAARRLDPAPQRRTSASRSGQTITVGTSPRKHRRRATSTATAAPTSP